ncbi:MAG: hypothetical protein IJ593_04505, partial [Lachnospiraceae bacterium]|nr:hypothetical protein [Lachnospiraceae bacterium]
MDRSTKIVKKLLALFLVVLMSIESFGAIVSDNDGSAFITKAEFDSKVNEFNTEINRYETSIDAKLQGAISSYVEGIRIQDRPTILYDKLKNVIGNKAPFFLNGATTGSSTLTSNVVINKNKNYSVYYVHSIPITQTPLETKIVYTVSNPKSGAAMNLYGWTKDKSGALSSMPWHSSNVTPSAGDKFILKLYAWKDTKVKFALSNTTTQPTDAAWEEVAAGNTINKTWNGGDYKWYWHVDYDNVAYETEVLLYRTLADDAALPERAKGILINFEQRGVAEPGAASTTVTMMLNNQIQQTSSRAGSGSQWTYELNPDGSKSLKRYWTTFYPQQNITLNYKTYKNYGTKTTVAQNDLKDDVTCVYTPSITPSYGKVSVGTNHTSYSTANKVGYCEEIFSLI